MECVKGLSVKASASFEPFLIELACLVYEEDIDGRLRV
jgi:hypothetical protein